MYWFAYIFLFIGVVLLLLTPPLILMLKESPHSALREQWHHTVSPKFAALIGITIITIAFFGGIFTIYLGINLLR